jgi:hypothetical protein
MFPLDAARDDSRSRDDLVRAISLEYVFLIREEVGMNIKLIVVALALGSSSVVVGQIDQQKTPEQQIEEALSALPESMRDDVRVEGFDDGGNAVTLREGTSHLVCHADDPNVRAWTVTCFPKTMEAFVTRSEALTKAGEDTPARIKILKAEIESGAITMPDVGALYVRSGNSVDIASAVMILHVPNATAESTGLPTLPMRGSPWLAEAGSVMANIRIARR